MPTPEPVESIDPASQTAVRYEVTHKTTYVYQHDVSVSHHIARLTPRTFTSQRCRDHDLRIVPLPAVQSRRTDYFGNTASFLTVEGAHRELTLEAHSLVDLYPTLVPAVQQPWESIRQLCLEPATWPAKEASEFIFSSVMIPSHRDYLEYARSSFPPDGPMLEGVLDLNRRIFSDFKFDPRATTVATPLQQVFKSRRGVCQDFAHLQIACFRALGLPARYVSGYLETKPPPGQPRLIGCDASHAWTQVWCGEFGWLDVDPTNNVLPNGRHITVARGRDYDDVSPVRGVILGGGEHELKVAVDVVLRPTLDDADALSPVS